MIKRRSTLAMLAAAGAAIFSPCGAVVGKEGDSAPQARVPTVQTSPAPTPRSSFLREIDTGPRFS